MDYIENISFMFGSCSSLISLPDISKWNTQNIINLNSIFEDCSLLPYIPNISKWKFNNKIKINNIFKGCNSLLIIPDISKWNVDIQEIPDVSSSNYNSIKIDKTDSISSEILYSSIYEDISSLKDNKDMKLIENNNFMQSKNELDDYYDNFYN